MSWGEQQYADYLKARAQRVLADHKKSIKGRALVRPVRREMPCGPRIKIVFRIFALRPTDWDASTFKELQDMLVKVGLLDDDKWDRLECGGIKSEKVYSAEEERTEVELIYP